MAQTRDFCSDRLRMRCRSVETAARNADRGVGLPQVARTFGGTRVETHTSRTSPTNYAVELNIVMLELKHPQKNTTTMYTIPEYRTDRM